MKRQASFAEILAEARAQPSRVPDVRPGAFNAAGELFDPVGNRLSRGRRLSPSDAQMLVRHGALLAWEGCGCGGWVGCRPEWVAPAVRGEICASKPRALSRHDIPTWIDLWEGGGCQVVFAHGVVTWGDALA